VTVMRAAVANEVCWMCGANVTVNVQDWLARQRLGPFVRLVKTAPVRAAYRRANLATTVRSQVTAAPRGRRPDPRHRETSWAHRGETPWGYETQRVGGILP